MKIVQNPESGEVGIELGENENYYIEDNLDALERFVAEKAIEIHKLAKSYKELLERLDVLEERLSKANEKKNED